MKYYNDFSVHIFSSSNELLEELQDKCDLFRVDNKIKQVVGIYSKKYTKLV